MVYKPCGNSRLLWWLINIRARGAQVLNSMSNGGRRVGYVELVRACVCVRVFDSVASQDMT